MNPPACLPAEKPPWGGWGEGVVAAGKGAPNMPLKPGCVHVSVGRTGQDWLYFT